MKINTIKINVTLNGNPRPRFDAVCPKCGDDGMEVKAYPTEDGGIRLVARCMRAICFEEFAAFVYPGWEAKGTWQEPIQK